MGKKLSDAGGGEGFAPTAMIREAGATLTGELVGSRMAKTQYGEKPVFQFKVQDAACKFTANKQEVEPAEGDIVDVFAPTRLARQLAQVTSGQSVTIKYLGTKKVGRGNPAHVFDVEVL